MGELRSLGTPAWQGRIAAEMERRAALSPEECEAEDREREADEARRAAERREAQQRELRARCLRVPAVDPDAAALALASPGRCPRFVGNAASEHAAEAVEAFVADRSARLLVLSGPAGRGKSWAATWALAELGGCVVPAVAIRPCEAWDALRTRAESAELVLLDDLGREHAGEWHTAEASALLELRHNAGRKTIATTNLLPAELAARYGDRLVSRLQPQRFGRIVACLGPAIGGGK